MNDHAIHDQATSSRPGIAIDPVCGMEVTIEGAQHTSEHKGKTYYFCARGCELDFGDDPERILASDYKPSM